MMMLMLLTILTVSMGMVVFIGSVGNVFMNRLIKVLVLLQMEI
jgi:hypothetical protein